MAERHSARLITTTNRRIAGRQFIAPCVHRCGERVGSSATDGSVRGRSPSPDRRSRGVFDSRWSQPGSNRRPRRCQRRALPTELWPQERHQSSDDTIATLTRCDGFGVGSPASSERSSAAVEGRPTGTTSTGASGFGSRGGHLPRRSLERRRSTSRPTTPTPTRRSRPRARPTARRSRAPRGGRSSSSRA